MVATAGMLIALCATDFELSRLYQFAEEAEAIARIRLVSREDVKDESGRAVCGFIYTARIVEPIKVRRPDDRGLRFFSEYDTTADNDVTEYLVFTFGQSEAQRERMLDVISRRIEDREIKEKLLCAIKTRQPFVPRNPQLMMPFLRESIDDMPEERLGGFPQDRVSKAELKQLGSETVSGRTTVSWPAFRDFLKRVLDAEQPQDDR